MNYVISLIVTYLFFNLLIVIPINYIKQTNYGKSLPLIFTSSVLVLYLSQIIFKSFLIGFYLLLILALLGLYLLIKNIKNKDFLNRYLTNGFYLFIIIFMVLALYNYKREFNVYDEFSHWEILLKACIIVMNFIVLIAYHLPTKSIHHSFLYLNYCGAI